jgi:hypothetical protein
MTTPQDPNAGWTRLEDVLTAMKPGETVSIDALVAETGLTLETITTVLNELARIDLFARLEEKVFVRRSLWQPTG